ncbi:MAG: segregation/condensation protein A [Planctomycetota bacterium]
MSDGPAYRVDLSAYNGPLDLLLHLIREREVDIHDIPIAEITEQYMEHLEVVKAVDVDRAGDFLLMAATLMLIKSRMLLPGDAAEDDGDDDLDPRTDLVRQLLEYKQFKDASRQLEDAQAARLSRFESGVPGTPPEPMDAGKLLEEIGVEDLVLAFERLMRETLSGMDHEVFGEELPVREVAETVVERLRRAGGTLSFADLFAERRDRVYIVSVFLSLLEMLREGRLGLEAGDNVIDLRLRLNDGASTERAGPRFS